MANVGMVGLDWQERINWGRMRTYRLERARERMKAHGLGAMLLMYDENVRYVTSTLTPGWNKNAYFGITATTGQLADNHDILSLLFR